MGNKYVSVPSSSSFDIMTWSEIVGKILSNNDCVLRLMTLAVCCLTSRPWLVNISFTLACFCNLNVYVLSARDFPKFTPIDISASISTTHSFTSCWANDGADAHSIFTSATMFTDNISTYIWNKRGNCWRKSDLTVSRYESGYSSCQCSVSLTNVAAWYNNAFRCSFYKCSFPFQIVL